MIFFMSFIRVSKVTSFFFGAAAIVNLRASIKVTLFISQLLLNF